MVGRTNVGGGGSAGSAFAYIHVTYSDTATSCTATKGTGSSAITLTAKGTSNLVTGQLQYVFCLPESGTWNVSMTNGSVTKSTACNMLTQNQMNDVTLSFSRIPTEYQEVAYIQSSSDGTNYIESGKGVVGTNEQLECDFMLLNDIQHSVLGLADSRNIPTWGVCYYSTANSFGIYLSSDESDKYYFTPSVSTKYSVVMNDSTHRILLNGTPQLTVSNYTTYGSSGNIHLFGLRNYYGSNMNGGASRIYKYIRTDWSNNTVTQNLVPCYRISDNKIGMYDLVSATFLEGKGTGTWSKGGNV